MIFRPRFLCSHHFTPTPNHASEVSGLFSVGSVSSSQASASFSFSRHNASPSPFFIICIGALPLTMLSQNSPVLPVGKALVTLRISMLRNPASSISCLKRSGFSSVATEHCGCGRSGLMARSAPNIVCGRLVHGRPTGDGDAAARFERAVDFGEALFAVGEEHEAEQREGGVEACVGIGQSLRIAAVQGDVAVSGLFDLVAEHGEHGFGEVDAVYLLGMLRKPQRQCARLAGDIEHG